MLKYMHIGGLRFLRIGRLQLSWCICKRRPLSPLETVLKED